MKQDSFSMIRTALTTVAGTTLALTTTSVAFAQDQTAGTAAPVAADSEDIVVTAQKRSERLVDVPLSVQALSNATLDRAVIQDIQDIAVLTPGVSISSSIANLSPYIRGIGTPAPLTGTESAVAIYIDGVYQSATVGNIFAFNNLQSVEVLKGPQGTLYGRNATGGVINVNTLDPSRDATAKLRLEYGNYDTITGQAYVSGAIAPSAAADFALYVTDQGDGFGRNLTLGTDQLKEKQIAARGKIKIDLGPDTTVRLGGDYTRIRSDLGVGAVLIKDGDDGAYRNVGFYDTLAGFPSQVKVDSYGGMFRVEHQFNSLNLQWINGYRKIDSFQQFSQYSDPAVPNRAEIRTTNKQESFSSELQLLSSTSGPFNWIVGAFYFHDKAAYQSPDGFTVTAATPFGQLKVANIGSTQVLNSISGFVDGSYRITGGLTLTAGLRYTSDGRDFVGVRNVTQAVQVVGGVPTVVNVAGATLVQGEATNNRLTYRVVVQQKLGPDMNLYGSYTTGFKSGGFLGNNPLGAPLRPENVKAMEIGFKGIAFDQALRFATAVFNYDYTDLQVLRVVGATPITENAARARIRGVEAEGDLRIVQGLNLAAGISYLDARYRSYPGVPLYVPVPGTTASSVGSIIPDARGNRLRNAPKWTFNAGLTYTKPIGSNQFDASINYYYNDGYYFYADEQVRQDSYSLVNAKIGWSFSNNAYSIGIFGKNLNGAKYFTACRCGADSGNWGSPGEPRRYGVQLDARF